MDIRSSHSVQSEDVGDESVSWLIDRDIVKRTTAGSFVDFVVEVEVRANGSTSPHEHPAHEWFYLLSGRGVVSVGDEEQTVEAGDCVYIPPGLVHRLRSANDSPVRMLAFGVAPEES